MTVWRARVGAWALATAAVLPLAACGAGEAPAAAPARTWPPDTVLALNGVPIAAAEVDAISSIVARAEVQHALPHLRRIALTNVILPRAAAREVAGEARRAAALAAAQAWRAALERDATPPPPVEVPHEAVVEGGFGMTGLEVWDWALDAPLATWSPPIETPGAWRLARVLERTGGLRPSDVRLKVDLRTFVWTHSPTFREDVEAHLDRSRLEYVDEAWRDLVPTLWQRRLRGTP
ncbi:MAG: hypothetical protein JNK02_16060 [Planctomycetes bacterium]|nr:hypothetical protein [Planctomycetota bacterium]